MPVSDPTLWATFRDWPLPHRPEKDPMADPPRDCRCFEHNLRKRGDWTDESAGQITDAYRRFLYLKALTGETLTPPKWIDEAWHLHRTFPDDYAALQVRIGRKIEHRQSLTRAQRHEAYDRGRALWRAEFDADPPMRLWPQRPAWWRAYAGLAVMALTILLVVVILASGQANGIVLVSLWFGGGILAAVLFARWSPETISRCG